MVEPVFSYIKRMLGDYVTVIIFDNVVDEMILKASLYNWFRSTTITKLSSNSIKN